MANHAIITDLNRCTGCLACTVACKAINGVDVGSFWIKTLRVGPHPIEGGSGTFPDVEMYFLPVQCQHCENPECVSVCPTGASQKLDDGVVIVDYDACITCGYCMSACPYGARSADEGSSYAVEMQAADQVTAPEYGVDHGARGKYRGTYGTVRKCTFCAHRIAEGEAPACCETCIGDARYFGDLNDPSSKVAQLAASPRSFRLREELGTNPSVYYLK